MSNIVYCNRVGENWQLFCGSCSVPVDVVSSETLVTLSVFYAPILCMDCDGNADEIPTQLLSDVLPYHLRLGRSTVLVNPFDSPVDSKVDNQRLKDLRGIWRSLFNREVKSE